MSFLPFSLKSIFLSISPFAVLIPGSDPIGYGLCLQAKGRRHQCRIHQWQVLNESNLYQLTNWGHLSIRCHRWKIFFCGPRMADWSSGSLAPSKTYLIDLSHLTGACEESPPICWWWWWYFNLAEHFFEASMDNFPDNLPLCSGTCCSNRAPSWFCGIRLWNLI